MSGSCLSKKCSYCNISLFNFSQYAHHLQLFHEHENDFTVLCHIENCQKTFKTVASYKQHNYRNHGTKNFLNLTDSADVGLLDALKSGEHSGTSHLADNVDFVELSESDGDNSIVHNFTMHTASFILNLKESHMLPDALIESVQSELDFLVKFTEKHYRSSIQKGLVELGANATDSKTFSNLLGEETLLDLHNRQLNTKFQFKKFIRHNFPFIAAKEYLLSSHDKKSKFHYVPIIDLLKAVILKPGFLEIITKDHLEKHHPHALYATCDGSISNSIENNSVQLKIQLYVDEFEVSKTLGAKRGKHKLTAVYFTINNVPLRCRNKDIIFLCLLVKHRSLKLYDSTYKKVFEPLMEDLHTLYEGIDVINVSGRDKRLTAVLEIVMGDNLSSHSIAGFQTNFNSGSICRYCTVQYSHFRNTLAISQLRPRTNETYENEIKYIDEDEDAAAVYGIKHKCVFSGLSYFKVPDSFPADIMHDCLEGVIPVTVYLVLKSLHTQKIITIAGLNTYLSEVKIPANDMPNIFKDTFLSDKKIVGSSAQSLNFS